MLPEELKNMTNPDVSKLIGTFADAKGTVWQRDQQTGALQKNWDDFFVLGLQLLVLLHDFLLLSSQLALRSLQGLLH